MWPSYLGMMCFELKTIFANKTANPKYVCLLQTRSKSTPKKCYLVKGSQSLAEMDQCWLNRFQQKPNGFVLHFVWSKKSSKQNVLEEFFSKVPQNNYFVENSENDTRIVAIQKLLEVKIIKIVISYRDRMKTYSYR